MIEIHTFRAAFGQPTGSPFGVKVIILCQMAGADYQIVYQDDPRKAPKGKFPIIVDDGVTVADSSFIRRHLEQKYGVDLDVGLSAEQRGASMAFQRLAEEHLYWSLVAARWVDMGSWPVLRDALFSQIPGIVRPLIAGQIRKKLLRDMEGHGMGRHTLEEMYAFGVENLQAIADWLGDKDFMHGTEPTAIDASVGAFVAGIHEDGFDTPLRAAARGHENLGRYAARIKERYYPDA